MMGYYETPYNVFADITNCHKLLYYKIMQGNINCLTEIVQVLTQMLQIRETYYL